MNYISTRTKLTIHKFHQQDLNTFYRLKLHFKTLRSTKTDNSAFWNVCYIIHVKVPMFGCSQFDTLGILHVGISNYLAFTYNYMEDSMPWGTRDTILWYQFQRNPTFCDTLQIWHRIFLKFWRAKNQQVQLYRINGQKRTNLRLFVWHSNSTSTSNVDIFPINHPTIP